MKVLIAILMITALMFSAPVMAEKAEMKPAKDKATEEFGEHVFSYLGGVAMLPVHVLNKAIRTLLYMDHE